jgi:hypothetical protein
MEWKIRMGERITIWKLGLGGKMRITYLLAEICKLTSTFHHVSAVFGSS